MRLLLLSLCAGLLLCAPAGVSAETLPASVPMRLSVDFARFRGVDDNHTLVEVYYTIAQSGLSHVADSAGYLGTADVVLVVLKKDSVVDAERWLVPSRFRDTSELRQNTNLVGGQELELGPGDYVLKLIGRDRANPQNADSVSLKLPVALYPTAGPVLSDIEFAAAIRQGQQGTPFYKNTLSVIPSVGGIFTAGNECYYYTELYNLLRMPEKAQYILRGIVKNSVGREVMSRASLRRRAGESSVIVDHFPIDTLHSGAYTLQLSVSDSAQKVMASHARRFFVYNPKLGIDSTLLAGARELPLAEYSKMDEQELDNEFSADRYEANDAEKGQYRALKGVIAKRAFLSEFWRRRPFELRDQYLSRVRYVNENYHFLGRDGYKTDRGRVYIMYGAPDEVERHPSVAEKKPYEIWTYHQIEGGVLFVFVQRNPGSDFELVHSTARNELHDENWDRIGVTQ